MDGRLVDERAKASEAAAGVPKASWSLIGVVSGLTFLSGLFVALAPAGSQTNLAGRTWEQFAAEDGEVAALFSMQLTLVGLMAAAFSLLALVVTVTAYRRAQRWAWYALWLLPITYALVSARMLSDGYQVGFLYAGLTILLIVGLAMPMRQMVSRTTGGAGRH